MKKYILSSLLALSSIAQAGEYSYHDKSPMHLGGGFDPFRPTEDSPKCVEDFKAIPLDTQSNRKTSIIMDVVKSRTDLYSKVEMSMSSSASYGAFSGNFSYSSLDEIEFNEDSLNWIVLFKSDLGKYGFSPTLKQEYKNYDNDELVYSCGSEVVTQERRGVMIYALVSVHNLSKNEKHFLEKSFSGSYGSGAFDASMDASYKSILNYSYAVGTVNVRIEAVGGPGIKNFAAAIGGKPNSYANYENLPTIISSYISEFVSNNAVPVQYFTTPILKLKGISRSKNESSFRGDRVAHLYEEYLSTLKEIKRIDDVLNNPKERSKFFADSFKNKKQGLIKSRSLLIDKMNSLYNDGVNCFNPALKNCSISPTSLNAVEIDWPELDKEKLCQQARDTALSKSLYNYSFYEMANEQNLVPNVELMNGKIGINGYETCEDSF